jgi:hypothetical protein
VRGTSEIGIGTGMALKLYNREASRRVVSHRIGFNMHGILISYKYNSIVSIHRYQYHMNPPEIPISNHPSTLDIPTLALAPRHSTRLVPVRAVQPAPKPSQNMLCMAPVPARLTADIGRVDRI